MLIIISVCNREKRQITQNQREGAKQYCDYAPLFGVIAQIGTLF